MRAGWCVFLSAAFLVLACSSSKSGSGSQCEGVGIPQGICDCQAGQTPLQPVAECSAATVGKPVVCCQKPGDCTCYQFGCDQVSASYCSCTPVAGGSLSQCTGTPCCLTTGMNAGECSCGISCGATDMMVASCTSEVILCAPGETRVDKCEPQ
jgi:hypothetical protein